MGNASSSSSPRRGGGAGGCGGCLAGLGLARRPSGLPPDVVEAAAPQGRRRFEVAEKQLTVEEVFALVSPRPPCAKPAAGAGGKVEQSWASPIPRSAGQNGTHAAGGTISLDIQETQRVQRRVDARDEVLPGIKPEGLSKFQVEQLIASPGCLPQPLAPYEREQIIRKLLPTATHEMLSRIPRHLVEAQSLEGQTLRRRLVNGATVVFFTAGYAGKRFVFERAAQLGIRSVVIEHPDSWARSLVDEGVIAKFIPVDMSQSSDVVLKEALQAIKGLGSDGLTGEADAVLSFVELSVPLVARLCEQLGLPGPKPSAVDAARDKHATRAALKAAGLPTPRNFLIHSEAEVLRAAQHVGYPAVLKPVSGAASLGVKKVESEAELLANYRQVISELSSLVVVSGALVQNDGSGQGVAADKVVNMAVLLEQYLDGTEVDIDVVMSEGEWRYAGITDNGPTVEPWFNETWGCCPSLLPLEKQRELKELGVACVKALGFDGGVFHVECKYTSTGPQLIEVNARMGGGPVHEHNLRTWRVDLVEEAIFVALGIPARPFVPRAPAEPIAYYLLPADRSGEVEATPELAALLKERSDIVWARNLVKVGDKVTGPKDGLPTWVMDIMVTGSTAKEALDLVFRLVEEYPIKVR